MKKIILISVSAGISLMLLTCKKDENQPETINFLPEPTPVGTLISDAGSGVVGAEGGSITTTDGKLELVFPSGSLNSSTNITIQTVTNNAPGGVGNAFRFGPEDVKLNKPVTLKFQYTDNDISGSLPMFLGMAVQDTDQIWYNLGYPVLDTLNKTISITSKKMFAGTSSKGKSAKTSNFLDHATFLDLYIKPESGELKISNSMRFQVFAVENHNPGTGGNDDEDDLQPLPRNHELSPNIVKQWSVNGVKNGNAEYGTVSPEGSACTYTAPGTKPSRNPVDLSADIKLWYKDPKSGRDFNNLKINAPIRIVDFHYKYELELLFKTDWTTYIFSWDLTDKATLDVDVLDGIVTFSNLRNNDGTVSPTTQSRVLIEGVITCTGNVEDGYAAGLLNITGGTGKVLFNDLDPNSPWLDLKITNSNGMYPKIKYECTNEEPAYQGGVTYPTVEYFLRFVATNEVQIIDNEYLKATLSPTLDQ